MTGRRDFMKLLLGGTTAAATVSPKDAAKALGLPGVDGMEPMEDIEVAVGGADWQIIERAMDGIWKRNQANSTSDTDLPVHIRTKKSWSPAFKRLVLEREIKIASLFESKVRQDEAFRKKIMEQFGVK